MKYAYPAIFTPIPEGFDVQIPDLPGCRTFGRDLPDSILMAEDALAMWLWDAEEQSEAIPAPSPQLNCAEPQFVSLIVADTDAYRKEHDARAVKKTLTLPRWLNTQAERANAPFSQILQEGLKKYLNIE